jgi:hypothetical protein
MILHGCFCERDVGEGKINSIAVWVSGLVRRVEE